ncbi:hypothetical protein B0H13DRAFT_2360046 [Mycena leptocephala]|nr:hypothetical protein B0H13DRAFT_2360046 [Mycena leptocephala]
MPLSPQNFSPETLAALQISADRAVAWTQEVQRERKFQQEHTLQLKSQLFPWDQEYWAYNHDYTFRCAKARAINTFRLFIRARYGKYMRARLRRYERLKYLYELDHPPFRTPEFPAHPSMTAWNAPIELQGSLDMWNGARRGSR